MSESHPDRPPVPRLPSDAVRPASLPSQPRDRQLPRYKVVLHRNPAVDLMVVVRSVMELTRFPRAEATHKMWEAHHNGRSVLLTTWLERAELYVEQFASRGLDTSVERV
ncbi:MAG: ATP-dependent Clp protease adaptor ClpS [Gemmataceae bacterium]